MKILIVEDNTDLQAIYQGLFEGAGHKIRQCDDGRTGLAELADFKPNVVLLDMLMPEMTGLDFLHALHEQASTNPLVIVCSNLSEAVDVDRALAAGAHYYLRKSEFAGEKLVQEVERLYAEYKEKTTTS